MKSLSYTGSGPRSGHFREESLSGSVMWPGANYSASGGSGVITRWKSRAAAGPAPQGCGQRRHGNKPKMAVEKVKNYTNVRDCYSFSTSYIFISKVLGLEDFTIKWFVSEQADARCSHIFSIRKIKHELVVYLGEQEARFAFKEDHPI